MKKLLAVVLSAAMVLGMGTMAFADEETTTTADPTVTSDTASEEPTADPTVTSDTASAEPASSEEAGGGVEAKMSLQADGNKVYVNVDEAGWTVFTVTVTWSEDVKLVTADDDHYKRTSSDFKDVATSVYNANNAGTFKASGVATSGKPESYTGLAFTLEFDTTEEVAVTLTDNEGRTASATINQAASTEAASTEAASTEAASTEAASTEAASTEAAATATPTAAAGTKSSSSTGTTTTTKTSSTGTSSTSSSTTAAKTADAAPVAAMAVLALAAAAVVVGMKKKVTE